MNPDDLLLCEECGEVITGDNPGIIFRVWGTTLKPGEWVPLHDEACRKDWFGFQMPNRWIKEREVTTNP